MKVNKIFHWLYFLMLLLPIFAIPMYAIYVRNENSTFAQEINVQENKVVDFNQIQNNGNFTNNNFWGGSPNTTLTIIENVGASSVVDTTVTGNKYIAYFSFDVLKNHTYYARFTCNTDNPYLILQFVRDNPFGVVGSNSTLITSGVNTYTIEMSSTDNTNVKLFYVYDGENSTYLNLSYCSLFDVTQMFGSGNEPTIEQFNQWYPNDYYEYTLSDKQLLKAIDQTTYNDTDVGSQFTYTIYNSIDKYFNYDKVFNFGDLYDWLQLNFFNGNAPLGFFIFWHYLIYFLLTSLLWLLFDVLMYVPNLIHKWLDKAS